MLMTQETGVDPAAFTYHSRLRKLKDYVDENYANDLSLGTAAKIAGLNDKYFSTFFRVKTGICYRDWIAGIRVGRAKEMLRTQAHTVMGVSTAVGYQDLRTFERAFKKQTGLTPLQYKRSFRPS
jgi:two-component system response regulator YesN